MMINHNNKDKTPNNKEPLIVQENDTKNNTFSKPRKNFPWTEYCEDGVMRLDCFRLVSF